MNEPLASVESQLGDELLAELVDGFLRRYRAGEQPSVDEYASKYPELANRIRELFPAMIAMEHPAGGPTIDFAQSAERIGATIGRYKLLERIGEGGFGVVYMAEQQQPVRRKIALKVIKPGMDSRQVLARFEAERQALAIMDHPNIAKVFDGGMTDSGRPYFVMELVRGVPITEYSDCNQLSPHERLELFSQVCHAVQHAHQKGIIHRDLKPTNVLVAKHDTTPVVKVIDFGVAKALGQELTDKTLFTGFTQLLGTPLYMSPEQAGHSSLDVDTRSDIYSLGVLLYELLTGTTPIDKKRFRKASYDEICRIIREEEPPRPSTRLSESKETLPSISAQRHIEPAKLTKLVRGELDWIVMKALEKDRTRRYETATGLARDIERYLNDEPVEACPPSAMYRFKKFTRRNKAPVLAATVLLLTLVGGIVGTSVGLARAKQARQAEAARAEGERLAKERAEANFALANEAVGTYLGAVTDAPELNQGDFNRLRKQLLESAIPFYERIAAQKSDDPDVEAARGSAYIRLILLRMTLGEDEAAFQDAESTRVIYSRLHSKFPDETAYSHGLANGLHNRGLLLVRSGKREEAEADYRQAIDIMEKIVAESPYEAARQDLAHGYHDLGHLLIALGKHEEAEAALRRALDSREKLVAEFSKNPVNRQKLAQSQTMMSAFLANVGEYEEAMTALARALEVQEKLGADFPNQLNYSGELSLYLNELGNLYGQPFEEFEKSEVNHRKALAIQEKLAAAFPTVPGYKSSMANSYDNLGIALAGQEKLPEAEASFREAIGIREKLAAAFPTIPGYQSLLGGSYMSLGNVLLDMGKRAEAETAYRTALEILEKHAADSPGIPDFQVTLAGAYCNFGVLLVDSGQSEQALEWLQKAIERLEGVLAEEPRLSTAREFLRNCHMARADALIALGRRTEALKSREQEVALNESLIGPNHFGTLTSMYVLTEEYEAAGRSKEALELRKELLKRRQQALGTDDSDALDPMANLTTEVQMWREDVLANPESIVPNYAHRLTTVSNLARTYELLGQHEAALVFREKILKFRNEQLGPDDPQTLASMHELAESLIACDRGAEGVTLIDETLQKAEGRKLDPELVPALIDLRLRHFEKTQDAAGCRATAIMWEQLKRPDADSLYSAACFRAVTATILSEVEQSGEAAKEATAEADQAMNWLTKAVAAGYGDAAYIKQDKDLDALREREDFKKLRAELESEEK